MIFWDESDKRGWLVSGTHALLHLVRESLQIDSIDEFSEHFLYRNGPRIQEFDSPIDVLMNMDNRKLKLYIEKEDIKEEIIGPVGGISAQPVITKTTTYIHLERRVEHYMEVLEKLFDYEEDLSKESGLKVNLRTCEVLQGCDFRSLALQNRSIHRLEAKIAAGGKGWVGFVQNIGATTLFGRGFGEILRPAPGVVSCAHWNTLPKGKYYLAVTVADLRKVVKSHCGDEKAVPMALTQDIIMHTPTKMFGSCSCSGKSTKRPCNYAQVSVSRGAWQKISLKPKPKPTVLCDEGAVVLGHNRFFR